MKNKKLFARLAAAVLSVLIFTACDDAVSGDMGVGEITIRNIPAYIPIYNNPGAEPVATFRVYLNASNSTSELVAPAAKGLAEVSVATLQPDGTHTVTIDLRQPNPGFGEPGYSDDPNQLTPSWFGTALFFSIMIAPQDAGAHRNNAIWVRADVDLNRQTRYLDWNALMDFRNPAAPVQAATGGTEGSRQLALFRIFLSDPQTSPTD